jgi:hypothetical protein
MAEADRHRLLERALALPLAKASDFFGGRRPPAGADPEHLRRIDDTSLRTKLVDAGLAEGLQSPKGPQRIASILRIYPNFDAPARRATNGRVKRAAAPAPAAKTRLPSIDEMERLLARLRELEAGVARELTSETNDRIALLKHTLSAVEGEDLERTYRELGEALERRRALQSQTRAEVFRRVESDASFPEREYLRFLRR